MRSKAIWRLLAVFAALALVLAACAGDDDGDDEADTDDTADADVEDGDDDSEDDAADEEPAPETVEGGTVLFGDEQEPTILNSMLIDGNSLVTTKVFTNILSGAHSVHPDFSLQPDLLDGEAEVTEDPFTVTYTIKEEAVWNDGTPVSADDFAFTFDTIMAGEEGEDGFEGEWDLVSRAGYTLIEDYEIHDEKTITFNFNEVYAPWQLMFGSILPKHALEGEDFDEVWNTELVNPKTGEMISSGPYVFDSWDQGQQIRLIRNEEYWGDPVALDEIVIRYVPDTVTLTQQMRGGEIDMYDPQPQIELVEQLEEITDRIEYEVGEGPVWEHIDFNTLVPGLDKEYVRQAMAYGIDRETIAEVLISPVNPDVQVLHNPIYMSNQDEYEPYFERYSHDPDQAISLLEENGCERGGDDIFECDGDRLAFRIGTTGGNERRELAQQLIQSDLAQVGIEISIENDDGAAFFERLNTPDNCDGVCDYDIAMFAWVGSPDPVGNANIYGCDFGEGEPRVRPQNWTVWCNEEASDSMDEANSTADLDERARLFNRAAEIMADEVPILPLFQQPQLLAWNNDITGPQLNATNATSFWNSGEWALTQ
jgi:peptide/nickel transport system substrate-binding protein